MATVLMVDDSAVSRKVLRNILEKGGYEVIGEAVNGEEGYLKYKELKPDIVTMDITMPVMDGIESLSLIKRDNEDTKVIMITASGQREKMVEALKRGAEEFILKPFEEDEILKTLAYVMEAPDETP
ncbi:MAG: response regulator [Bacteroidales bacterium]|nr:response regulator [Lachnoclostridium sp.]MCM1384974.1 response regulator [Lachnoclostridium sp.]MCM1465862.1 response regulator [Bacteroidales bacterium]